LELSESAVLIDKLSGGDLHMVHNPLAQKSVAHESSMLAKLAVRDPLSAADYDLIRAAVMETARGRWFLAEYAQRNRNADTEAVLAAIGRIEAAICGEAPAFPPDLLRAQLMAMAEVIARIKTNMAALALGQEHPHTAGASVQKVIAVLRDLDDQIHVLREAWGNPAPAPSEPAGERGRSAAATGPAPMPPLSLVELPPMPQAYPPDPEPVAGADAWFPDWLLAPDEPASDRATAFASAETEPPETASLPESLPERMGATELGPETKALDLAFEPPAPPAAVPAAIAEPVLPAPTRTEIAAAPPATKPQLPAVGLMPADEPAAPDIPAPQIEPMPNPDFPVADLAAAVATFEEELRTAFAKAVDAPPAAGPVMLPPRPELTAPMASPLGEAAPPVPEARTAIETAAALPPPPSLAQAKPGMPWPAPSDPLAAVMALSEEERIALFS
jgi:hypothetical protein